MHWAGGYLPGGCLPRGVSGLRGWGCLPRGVSVWDGVSALGREVSALGGVCLSGVFGRHPPVDRMTDRCKNITFDMTLTLSYLDIKMM